MSGRIPYTDLDRDDQDAIKAWLVDHRVNPDRVPIDAQFDRDPATGEWRIPVCWHDADGRMAANPDGETVRSLVVRRRELRPLPWPREFRWPLSSGFEVTYRAEPGEASAFLAALAKLTTTRACRTCDYGDDPACGHEGRAERACAAPVGDFDCAVVPCLGACANPTGGA